MDVKFPLDNYLKYLETENDHDKESYKKTFLKDVKIKIKEISSRNYINPADNTVDYVILFIPNDQIYTFIHEQDQNILDEAIKNKVIFCSPVTLFAVLAVIRQAVDNFALEKRSHQILQIVQNFRKQWDAFVKKFEDVGKRLDSAQKEFATLTTTRKRMLDNSVGKIDEMMVGDHKEALGTSGVISSEQDPSAASDQPQAANQ